DVAININSGSNIKPINLKFTRHSGKWLPQFFIATTNNNPNEIVPIKTSWIDNDIKIIFPEIIVHDRRVTYNDNLVVSSCLANFSTQQDSEVVDELRSFNLKLDFVEKVVDDFITIFSQSGYNDLDNIYNQTKNILKIDVAELISNPYLFDDIQDLDRIRSVLQRLIDEMTPLLDHKRKSEIMLSIEDIRTLLDNLIIPAFDDSPEVQSSKYSYIMSKSWDYVTSKVLAQYKARKEISSFYDKSINRDNIFLYISRFFCFTALVLAFIPLIIPMQQILIIAIPIFCVAVALLCFKLGQKFTTRMELTEGLRHADVEMFSLGSDDFLQAEKNKSFDKISAKSDAEAALERDKRILSDLLGI
ncbi:MAG: hypothetical protein VX335_05545, partial [Pseudomonadota bacterium]|nr:hypothetical protein [Pseudomonadota bacterium]